MRVIGLGPSGTYIVEISHSEVEKVADKYYGTLPALKVGDTYNLGQGYDFRGSIQSVCNDMTTAMRTFDRSAKTLTDFAHMVSKLEGESNEPHTA